jgi:hypothetical protein
MYMKYVGVTVNKCWLESIKESLDNEKSKYYCISDDEITRSIVSLVTLQLHWLSNAKGIGRSAKKGNSRLKAWEKRELEIRISLANAHVK